MEVLEAQVIGTEVNPASDTVYFVNFVIFVPHVGQVARSMLRPLAVFSMVV